MSINGNVVYKNATFIKHFFLIFTYLSIVTDTTYTYIICSRVSDIGLLLIFKNDPSVRFNFF